MKRIGLLLTLAAVMGAMLAISATGAAAEPVCTVTGPEPGALFTETCVETTTTTREESEPVTETCQIGQSGRTGTQEGTRTRIYEVTTTTTTVTVYQGIPQPWKTPVSGPTTTTETSDPVLISETFTPTGRCVAPTGRP